MTGNTDRLQGSPPVANAEAAAESVENDATVLVSGFGRVGYPKKVLLVLASSNHDFALSVVSGGSVGSETDSELVEAGVIDRQYP